MLIEHPFGTEIFGKKNAIFVALTASCQIYLDYEDPTMSPEMKNMFVPMIATMYRWDGRIGLVGGFQESGCSFLDCAKAELDEEIDFQVDESDEKDLVPVCAHELDKLVVHLYHYDLGVVDMAVLKGLLRRAALAKHSCSEANMTWTHLADYGRGKGVETTLNSNILASAVKEELEIIITRLKINE